MTDRAIVLVCWLQAVLPHADLLEGLEHILSTAGGLEFLCCVVYTVPILVRYLKDLRFLCHHQLVDRSQQEPGTVKELQLPK